MKKTRTLTAVRVGWEVLNINFAQSGLRAKYHLEQSLGF